MSKQTPPAPTASAVGPCPTPIQISRTRTPWHWKFIQHHRTTRPPQTLLRLDTRLGDICKQSRPSSDVLQNEASDQGQHCSLTGISLPETLTTRNELFQMIRMDKFTDQKWVNSSLQRFKLSMVEFLL